MSTPQNPEHGREATTKDLAFLRKLGLPKHALAHHIRLYQVGKDGPNFGKWMWMWGDAFLGFHGQFSAMGRRGAIDIRFNKGDILPFKKSETDIKLQLGFGKANVPEILKQIASEMEEADNVESEQTPIKPSAPKRIPGAPIKPIKVITMTEALKRPNPFILPEKSLEEGDEEEDDHGMAEELGDEEKSYFEPPTKKQKIL